MPNFSPDIFPEIVFNNSEEIFSNERHIWIHGRITDVYAISICRELISLMVEMPEPITLYISSLGGEVTAGLAIYDTLRIVQNKCKVVTVAVGDVCSIASLIFAAGTPNNRYMMQHSRMMIHQTSTRISGDYHDVSLHFNELRGHQRTIEQIYYTITREPKIIARLTAERAYWLTSQKAVAWHLADHILD